MTIIKYQNGNCYVSINTDDGTKTRSCDGVPRPEFPESIDLKITNRCDLECEFCHESAVPDGDYSMVAEILYIMEGLPAGVEIAIGGGNVMSFVDLNGLLLAFAEGGIISNITLHIDHVLKHSNYIERLRRSSLVYGIGISGCKRVISEFTIDIVEQEAPGLFDNNTMFHFVVGIDNLFDVIYIRPSCKILILGYKQRGRGKDVYGDKVKRNIDRWRYFLPAILSRQDLIISFDNLALEQLPVRQQVSPEVWQSSYMGDDGQFSMFVDAVNMEYAASSADEIRRPLNGMTIREAFKMLGSDINAG